MGIIQQNSRISFHTITATGASFSVPTQEDFTSKTSPWSIYDLCLSEIGVNKSDEKAYIRIGSSIKEFQFTGATSGGVGPTGPTGPSSNIGLPSKAGFISASDPNWITGGYYTYEIHVTFSTPFDSASYSLTVDSPDGMGEPPADHWAFDSLTQYGFRIVVNDPSPYDFDWIAVQWGESPIVKSASLTETLALGNTMSGTITSPDGTGILTISDGALNLSRTDFGSTYSQLSLSLGQMSFQLNGDNANANVEFNQSSGINMVYSDLYTSNNYNNYINISSQQINIWATDPTIATSSYIILNRTDSLNPSFDAYAEIAVDNTVRYDALIIDPSGLNIGDLSLYSSDKLSTDASAVKLNPTEITISTSAVSNVIKANTLNTTAAGTYSISTLPTLATSNSITIKAKVIGFSSGSSLTYGSDLFAVFANYGGTVTQISTTDIIEKTDFGAGWTSDIETDGTDIFIKVKANGSNNTNWNVMYEYIKGA